MRTKIIVVDIESYWDMDVTLRKLTMEEYIRHPRFEVIGLSVKVDDGITEWASGSHTELKQYLKKFDWENAIVVGHNLQFDAAILSWVFDIHPKYLADTLSMSRALHGVEADHRLAALAIKYGLGEKGNDTLWARGLRRSQFSEVELSRYGDYCINDTELTYKLFSIFAKHFPAREIKLIDLTLKMFTEPVLELDEQLLRSHLQNTIEHKKKLLETITQDENITQFLVDPNAAPLPPAGIDVPNVDNSIYLKSVLMSNPKMADILRALDVEPPMKKSPATGESTYAFAKTDEPFQALLEHEDPRVQAVVAARLGVKSTIEETRTKRFIGVAERGTFPVPIKYYGAHTGRWSGLDYNIQNLPSRGANAKTLKRAIMAPSGYVIIDADSSQIEARILAWLAGQDELVQGFRDGRDVYREMGTKLYSKPMDQITDEERFYSKTCVLSAGYGVGADKFRNQMRIFGKTLDEHEARRLIKVYRESNPKIVALWKQAQLAIVNMHMQESCRIGTKVGVLEVVHKENAIRMPSGMTIKYDRLTAQQGEKGVEYYYHTRRSTVKIYGGKCVENICQGLARCIIGEQMLKIAKRYKVVMTVHDSVVCCVREEEAEVAAQYITDCMRWVPNWAFDLPVNCEVKIGLNYGDCEKWTPKKTP